MNRLPRRQIILGDALDVLGGLPSGSVDVVVTSPPYFLLRSYGAGKRELGQEHTVSEFIGRLLDVCDEIARVLKPTGSAWINVGDSYSRHARYGAPPKGLLLVPQRLAIGLADRGHVVRNHVVWAKPNPMPASVGDRLSCTHETVLHVVRARRYFYDLDRIRVPMRSTTRRGLTSPARQAKTKTGQQGRKARRPVWAGPLAGSNDGLARAHAEGRSGHPSGLKNPGDTWTIPTASFRGAHHAVFPEALVERPLLATCPARTCVACGRPWHQAGGTPLRPDCACRAGWQPGVVLDPFMGSGTTAVVAERLGFDWLGIELTPSFRTLALSRIAASASVRAHLPRGGDAQPQGASHAQSTPDTARPPERRRVRRPAGLGRHPNRPLAEPHHASARTRSRDGSDRRGPRGHGSRRPAGHGTGHAR